MRAPKVIPEWQVLQMDLTDLISISLCEGVIASATSDIFKAAAASVFEQYHIEVLTPCTSSSNDRNAINDSQEAEFTE